MATHKVRLKHREIIAEDTMAFFFDKPAGFEFRAGQFISLSLIDPPVTDDEGVTRTLSLASAPYEEELMVATRMRLTAFKRVLKTVPLESEVRIEGPFGSLTLHNNVARPAVFLAGGIGITPFRSILRQASKEKCSHQLVLFYSNRRPEDAGFLEELRELERVNPNYRFIGTVTKAAQSHPGWQGQTGHIDKDMLSEFTAELAKPIYYIAGPPTFVDAMQKLLGDSRIDSDDIRAEEFAGY